MNAVAINNKTEMTLKKRTPSPTLHQYDHKALKTLEPEAMEVTCLRVHYEGNSLLEETSKNMSGRSNENQFVL